MKTTQEIITYSETENLVVIKASGIKRLMKTGECFTGQGFFSVEGKSVIYTMCNVTASEADDAFTDDMTELRSGNVYWY